MGQQSYPYYAMPPYYYNQQQNMYGQMGMNTDNQNYNEAKPDFQSNYGAYFYGNK